MPKQWFFEVMGELVGPLTSAELIQRAQKGEVLPDTRVRIGTDGKWQLAARVKGLFPRKPAPPPPETPAAPPQPQSRSTDSSAGLIDTSATLPLAAAPAATSQPREYEFYDMVGFEDALGHALYQAVREYAREHGLTMTALNRQALAEFIGKPEFAAEPQPPAEAAEPQTPSATGIS
jgi:GYF domain 2